MKQLTITKEELYDLYINRNLSSNQIALILNCSGSTITRKLKKFKIFKSNESISLSKKLVFLDKYGVENPASSLSIQEKKKKTNLERYGVEYAIQSKEVQNKIKQTNLERYGVENPFQSKEVQNKISNTNLEKYGFSQPSKNLDIKEKTKQTCLQKYNKISHNQFKDIQEKKKQKFLKRYGVENPFQSKEIQDKIKQTNLEKYGVKYSSQKHLPKETLDIISDKEKLKNFILNSDNKNGVYLAEKLEINPSGFYVKIHNYGLYDLLDHTSSSYEEEIKEYFESKNIKLEKTRDILKPLEIDLYDHIHKVGIEFNGNYWHSDKVQKDKFYHQKKSLLAEQKGIKLFHIWEYEWLLNKDKILMMLDNLFGFSNVIYARNCKIVEISTKDKSKFLNENHLQGNDHSQINLGLVHKNILVSVMTFCKPRFNKNYEWELSRFCNLKNTRVVGGASKLFKYFISKYKPKSVISYSDISKTTGNMYSKLGFTLDKINTPDYIWIDSKMNVKSRYICKMKNEKQIMEDSGYYRIYKCGTKTWIWKNNDE